MAQHAPKEAGFEHEVEYESVLVAVEDSQYSPEVMSTAVKLAARRRRGIHLLVTITVPSHSSIDAEMPAQQSRAQSVIDSARVAGGRRVTGHWEKVRAGEHGRRIVREAREINSRAIVMSLPPRRAGTSLFGKTIETVLAERPCRVIIDSSRGLEKSGVEEEAAPEAPRVSLASSWMVGGMIAAVGAAIVAATLARGGGPPTLGVVLGVLLAALGMAALWLARGGRPDGER